MTTLPLVTFNGGLRGPIICIYKLPSKRITIVHAYNLCLFSPLATFLNSSCGTPV